MTRYEDIIKHLEGSRQWIQKWDVPFELCEAGIIAGTGQEAVRRSYTNKILNQLQEEGLVFFDKKHILGVGTRRRKAYFLTPEGQAKLMEVLEHD